MKTKLKKLNKAIKEINKFVIKTIKNYKTMKQNISKTFALLILAMAFAACGSTKVMVDRPSQGTQTTITVTTNNPITTTTDANASIPVTLK